MCKIGVEFIFDDIKFFQVFVFYLFGFLSYCSIEI